MYALLPPQRQATCISYRTRTGALLRVDGVAAGAYDREHHDVLVPPSDRERALTLEVELEALPTNGLPSGPGVIWWFLNAVSHQRPQMWVDICHPEVSKDPEQGAVSARDEGSALPVIGHSHLDVAWLWTYEQTRRKAERTFAIACDLLDRDPQFRFAQSQPQLYRFVEEGDPELFKRVRTEVGTGRFDPDVAALWVESDCNLPSGESLLRQMLFANEYCMQRFGMSPSIAWLPDSFGFANTLPQLLAHAGIPSFATTKLQWNDTTRFPYPQFVWKGPDGSAVIGALIQSYDGGPYPWRIRTARERHEPLIVGYGDGGGGVTSKMLTEVREFGRWIRPREWFAQLEESRGDLPVHEDELYLEYHRGVYTTHHDVKFQNALLERALSEAEELVAWCDAVQAPAAATQQFGERMRAAWEIVLRNQFHDVLPGTSIEPVYADVAGEYIRAQELVAGVIGSAETILPHGRSSQMVAELCEPIHSDGDHIFDNGLLQARVRDDGTLAELRTSEGRNLCIEANVLATYRDRPRQWEAWNIDDGYQQTMRIHRGGNARIEGSGLAIDYEVGKSPAAIRFELRRNEPFLRVDLAIDWRERRTLLRVENRFALGAQSVTYGSPHGSIVRSALRNTPQERAKFEVPGQRFAFAGDAQGDGVAILSRDAYGWSALAAANEIALGHSLLRGTTWPDPGADLGEHYLSYAFAPFAGARIGRLERIWSHFAHEQRVRLFTCEDESVLVVACKPAEDRDGAIVRVRECDGSARAVRLRCGARMIAAHAVDALERPIEAPVAIDGEHLVFDLAPYQLRSFRVKFRNA
jgi:alpha-mannosidase